MLRLSSIFELGPKKVAVIVGASLIYVGITLIYEIIISRAFCLSRGAHIFSSMLLKTIVGS